tara:strand:+ start:16460 stop:18259 length:1800 start_codon:yes stop_codon:yes gene_type:complete
MPLSARLKAYCFTVGSFALVLSQSGCNSEVKKTDKTEATTEVHSDERHRDAPQDAPLPFASPVSREMRELREDDWFEDRSAALGIDFSYRDGSNTGCYQLLESVGGGVAVLDYDGDGWVDLFFTGGGSLAERDDSIQIEGHPAGLFRNCDAATMADVSASAGLGSGKTYTHGASVADLNADGFQDVVVAGFGAMQVWINTGDGTFIEQGDMLGLHSKSWNVSPAAADINNDGLVDIYVLTYAEWLPDPKRVCLNDKQLHDICGPTMFPGSRDVVFVNNGQQFDDVSATAGIIEQNRGLGIVTADLDDNGFIDFVVVNDVQENQLYLNSGSLPWSEDGVLGGIAYSESGEREGSMGIDLADFDGDGGPDLWYTNYTHQDNSLLRNIEGSGFVHCAGLFGLSGDSRSWVGFGTGFGDFNGDGWPDLYVINGHVAYDRLDSPYFQPPQLFVNQQGKRYRQISQNGGPYFDHDRSGRGSAVLDWNNDGGLDLAVVHQNEPVALLTNQIASSPWLSIDLVGTTVERSAVGARVKVQTSERPQTQWKISGGGYASHKDGRLLFALPDTNPVTVTVTWLGGTEEVHKALLPGSYKVVEGADAYVVK